MFEAPLTMGAWGSFRLAPRPSEIPECSNAGAFDMLQVNMKQSRPLLNDAGVKPRPAAALSDERNRHGDLGLCEKPRCMKASP
jgi:hypothetical protein